MINTIKKIGDTLISKKWTLATAESCTGGLISAAITDMAGSSLFYKGSVIAYDNQVKMSLLGVSESTLSTYGAVSSQTVEAMAKGTCKLLGTDCAISVSGIAGPAGGTPEKKVGLVYIGIDINNKISCYKYNFYGTRKQVRNDAVKCALMQLLINLQ